MAAVNSNNPKDSAQNTVRNGAGENIRIKTAGRTEDVIDLYALFLSLLEHIWVIIAVTIVCGVLAGAYSYMRITPMYSATAKIYVVSSSGDSVVNLSDLNIGTALTGDYQELLKTYPVLDAVNEEMGSQYTKNQLLGMLSVKNLNDTRILALSAYSSDPEEARDLANAYAKVAVDYLPRTMNTVPPNIAQQAILPAGPYSPNNKKNALMGAMFGFVVICGIYTLLFLLDDTFHTTDDIENYLGVVPLAVIPEAEIAGKKKKKSKRRRGKR